MAGIGDALDWARTQVASRVPKADLDQRDPDYIREQLPGTWLLASLYFRADVRGMDRIPAEGPVLLVGNHSGGNVPPDTFVFTLAFCSYFGVERPFYQLAHNLVVSAPPLGWLRKFGTVAANHENARLALESGAALLVYPGGDYEVFRPSWKPKLLRVDKLARLKSVPISLALPWGLNISDLAGHIPLPAKIVVEALDPIDVDGADEAVHDKVLASLQAGVDRLAAERRFPVIG
jgi:1-acyl-sn-glycerol-3-phosphate acyltransferase